MALASSFNAVWAGLGPPNPLGHFNHLQNDEPAVTTTTDFTFSRSVTLTAKALGATRGHV